MKVEFTDEYLTTARVTRGWWRWKRAALVRCIRGSWYYVLNGDYPGFDIERACDEAAAKIRRDQLWPRVTLPVARLLTR